MSMDDWRVSSYTDPDLGQHGTTWVYYENPSFSELHLSRSVDSPQRDHTALNDRTYYYFGVTGTFNAAPPQAIANRLIDAWSDYFTVYPTAS